MSDAETYGSKLYLLTITSPQYQLLNSTLLPKGKGRNNDSSKNQQ
ncbi:hypothetical protein [Cesiribacter sp. SM1]|nr:hypothetical protein [Cesiribacter sp. SM1]